MQSTGQSREERRSAPACSVEQGPLVVRPARAAQMLSTCRVRIYQLIEAGELNSFRDGGARKITVDSINAYIARKLDEAAPARAA